MAVAVVVRDIYDECACGARKQKVSPVCRQCWRATGAERAKRAKTCGCGNPKDRYSEVCRTCRDASGDNYRNDPATDPKRDPSEAEAAWAAGFYEGEGSAISHAGSFGLTFPQQDPQVLHRLAEFFGGTVRGPDAQGMSTVVVYGRRASRAAAYMWPWLSDRRRRQIQDAIPPALLTWST